jgi:hypothetical protein
MTFWFHKHDWRIEMNPVVIGERCTVFHRTDDDGWFFTRDPDQYPSGVYLRRLTCAVCSNTKWETKSVDRSDWKKA